jgi:hypothetical protein
MIKFREKRYGISNLATKTLKEGWKNISYYGKNPKKLVNVKMPAELRRAKESPFKTLGTLSGPAVTGGLMTINPALGAIPGTSTLTSAVGRKLGKSIDKSLGLGKRVRKPTHKSLLAYN